MHVKIPYTRLDRFRSGLGPLPRLLPQVVVVCRSLCDMKKTQCPFSLEAPDIHSNSFGNATAGGWWWVGGGGIVMDICAHLLVAWRFDIRVPETLHSHRGDCSVLCQIGPVAWRHCFAHTRKLQLRSSGKMISRWSGPATVPKVPTYGLQTYVLPIHPGNVRSFLSA